MFMEASLLPLFNFDYLHQHAERGVMCRWPTEARARSSSCHFL